MNKNTPCEAAPERKSTHHPFPGTVRFGGVGGLVQALLQRAGLDYRAAERTVGADHTTWYRWANDERLIPDIMLTKLAEAADVDPEQVFGYALLTSMKKYWPYALRKRKIRLLLRDVLALVEE